jgi:metal-sulfur cluster biosynthetic enzyme
MIDHMREEFLPVDAEAQTDAKQLIDAYASTLVLEVANQEVNVDVASLGLLEEVGVNTEELKE